ncbi:MAG: FlgD immunoglobulin-like domain containing protein [Gemmatimonadota bacterium]|jgi:hypothetical protein|nr:FlgD immunoglobulin-like domain containing protein [Gemmatimonadota bacterium]MDP6802867.1 FlgD immunoglobulin-like domain containing protein [Gemmatimonadota bacterium]MDP7032187.1 FlgD immunoglobulin-like domain containing protein [Gemmatimonadota bacterium]
MTGGGRRRPAFGSAAALGLLIAGAAIACDPGNAPDGEQPYAGARGIGGTAAGSYSHPISLSVCLYDSECNGWLTPDEQELFFIRLSGVGGPADSGHQGNWDLYHAEWDSVAGDWGPDTNLGPGVNTAAGERRPTTTADGDTLLYASGAVIRCAVRTAGVFTQVDSLFVGSDPCLSANASQLYYVKASNIWLADRGPSGAITDWVNHRAAPGAVNSPNAEVRPYISRDGQRLYFSDFGGIRPGGYGNADLWVSELVGAGVWGPPQNLGAPVNTDGPACTPWASVGEDRLVISSGVSEGTRGIEDLWVLHADSSVAPDTVVHPDGVWAQLGELDGAWNVNAILGETGGTLHAATSPEGAVYRSTDAGASWAKSLLPGAMNAYSLLQTPGGDLYAGTYPDGDVFFSGDDGLSWIATGDIPGATAVRALLSTSDGRVLAGTSPNCDIYATVDSGATWTALGATSAMQNKIATLYEPSPGILLAGGWGRLNRSTDGGATWTGLMLGSGMWSVESFHNDSAGRVWWTGWSHDLHGGQVRWSTDVGVTWTPVASVEADSIHAIRIFDLVETPEGDFLVGFQPGMEQPVCRTGDDGATWTVEGTMTGVREVLRFHKDSGGVIYAATTPNGDLFRWDGGSATGAALPGDGPAPVRMTAVLGGVPNPFRERTVVSWQVPRRTAAELSIVDVAGRHVRSLFAGPASAGLHETAWDGRDESGVAVASGIYFARLRAGESVTFQRVTRVR